MTYNVDLGPALTGDVQRVHWQLPALMVYTVSTPPPRKRRRKRLKRVDRVRLPLARALDPAATPAGGYNHPAGAVSRHRKSGLTQRSRVEGA